MLSSVWYSSHYIQKRNVKTSTRTFQKYKRRINSNIFSTFFFFISSRQELESTRHIFILFSAYEILEFSSPFSIQYSSHFLIMFRIFVPGKQKKPKRKLYRTNKKQKIGMKQIIKHKIKTSIIRNQEQKFGMKISKSKGSENRMKVNENIAYMNVKIAKCGTNINSCIYRFGIKKVEEVLKNQHFLFDSLEKSWCYTPCTGTSAGLPRYKRL